MTEQVFRLALSLIGEHPRHGDLPIREAQYHARTIAAQVAREQTSLVRQLVNELEKP